MKISIIIPTLNEAEAIIASLQGLQYLRHLGHEVIVADGGSLDSTLSLAMPYIDAKVLSDKGRAKQLNAGTRIANGDVLLFLHADTLLPENIESILLEALSLGFSWGRFDVRLSGQQFMFRIIEKMINIRSRVSGIATGDQAIFIRKDVFAEEGGFPEIALMEDIAMSKRLKKRSRPFCSRVRVITSSRRWEDQGIWKTIFLMWCLRLAYLCGVKSDRLAQLYRS